MNESALKSLQNATFSKQLLICLRQSFHVRQATIAGACGVTTRTVRAWEHDQAMSPTHAELLGWLAEVVNELAKRVEIKYIDGWLVGWMWLFERREAAIDLILQGRGELAVTTAKQTVSCEIIKPTI